MRDDGHWALEESLPTFMDYDVYLDFLHFLSSGALSLVAIFQNLISHLGIELQPVTGGSWRTWKDFFFPPSFTIGSSTPSKCQGN